MNGFTTGQIEFEEFCTLAARFLVEEDAEAMQQELKEAFRLYDKEGTQYNSLSLSHTHTCVREAIKFLFLFLFLYFHLGNGYITTAVLREILKELDDKITNEDLDMMIEEIDSDGSGTVDFDGKY